MATISITPTPLQAVGLSRAAAKHNDALQSDQAKLTDEQYLQAMMARVMDSYAEQYAVHEVSRTEFLRRIPADKRIAIRAAAKASPELADYMALLDATPTVSLLDKETIGGVAALVAAGILTQAEADVILEV